MNCLCGNNGYIHLQDSVTIENDNWWKDQDFWVLGRGCNASNRLQLYNVCMAVTVPARGSITVSPSIAQNGILALAIPEGSGFLVVKPITSGSTWKTSDVIRDPAGQYHDSAAFVRMVNMGWIFE